MQKQIDQGVAQARKKNGALNPGVQRWHGGARSSAFRCRRRKEMIENIQASIEDFNKAGELDPNQVAVWSHLAGAYGDLAGVGPGPSMMPRWPRRIETYNKALTLKPKDDASPA